MDKACCGICLERLWGTKEGDFLQDAAIAVLRECGHALHLNCLSQCLDAQLQHVPREKLKCPLCNTLALPSPTSTYTDRPDPYVKLFLSGGDDDDEDEDADAAADPTDDKHWTSQINDTLVLKYDPDMDADIKLKSASLARQTGLTVEVIREGVCRSLNEYRLSGWAKSKDGSWEVVKHGQVVKLEEVLLATLKKLKKKHAEAALKTEIQALNTKIHRLSETLVTAGTLATVRRTHAAELISLRASYQASLDSSLAAQALKARNEIVALKEASEADKAQALKAVQETHAGEFGMLKSELAGARVAAEKTTLALNRCFDDAQKQYKMELSARAKEVVELKRRIRHLETGGARPMPSQRLLASLPKAPEPKRKRSTDDLQEGETLEPKIAPSTESTKTNASDLPPTIAKPTVDPPSSSFSFSCSFLDQSQQVRNRSRELAASWSRSSSSVWQASSATLDDKDKEPSENSEDSMDGFEFGADLEVAEADEMDDTASKSLSGSRSFVVGTIKISGLGAYGWGQHGGSSSGSLRQSSPTAKGPSDIKLGLPLPCIRTISTKRITSIGLHTSAITMSSGGSGTGLSSDPSDRRPQIASRPSIDFWPLFRAASGKETAVELSASKAEGLWPRVNGPQTKAKGRGKKVVVLMQNRMQRHA